MDGVRVTRMATDVHDAIHSVPRRICDEWEMSLLKEEQL